MACYRRPKVLAHLKGPGNMSVPDVEIRSKASLLLLSLRPQNVFPGLFGDD